MDDKTLNRGEWDTRATEEGVSVVKWKDNKGILFISNCHNPSSITNVNRKMKNGTTQVLACPIVVKDYNVHMGQLTNRKC
ncbi:hypothetical protein NQ314_000845 [Rhamnusium bicolor]|uniref:PiggyBac transposable element-derived protein domain-containing protein n=1 Tax=Rhamnusium bicolor TaxID=1586634 RepID=A0AAV8ZWY5_9CUCU|nr:hypothetical protein NQ314_000845 [Rhamnusium bicolor]